MTNISEIPVKHLNFKVLCPTSFTAKLVWRARAEDLKLAFKLKPIASRNTQGRNKNFKAGVLKSELHTETLGKGWSLPCLHNEYLPFKEDHQ